ncbi:MAG: hypothetical protein ABEJ25_02775, partial [Candidatus Bipolaricaulia bacterium]
EIGNSDFHAGEIACGFIEQLPEKLNHYQLVVYLLLPRSVSPEVESNVSTGRESRVRFVYRQ